MNRAILFRPVVILMMILPAWRGLGPAPAVADQPPVQPYQFTEDFESHDPVRFWTANGPYTINASGLTQERSGGGQSSYKLDVTVGDGNYFYWRIPLPARLPADVGTLTLTADVYVDPATTLSVAIGMDQLIYFGDRQLHGGCISGNQSVRTKGQWQHVSIDLVNAGKNVKQSVLSKENWGIDETTCGVYDNSIVILFQRTAQPNNRAVIYLDNLQITGSAAVMAAYQAELRARAQRGLQKVLAKTAAWEQAMACINAALALIPQGQVQADPILHPLADHLAGLQTQLTQVRNEQTISKTQLAAIDPYLGQAPLICRTIERAIVWNQQYGGYHRYRVTPVTGYQYLPDTQNVPGELGGEISVQVAPGQYQAASFLIQSAQALPQVNVQVSDLHLGNQVLPAAAVDVKVVKCWYQSGESWTGIGQNKNTIKLVPELLLNDDTLVQVDHVRKGNDLKLQSPGGAPRYVDISNPNEAAVSGVSVADGDGSSRMLIFDPSAYPVKDSATLQPVDIPAGTNRQFWLTIHVPDGTTPGLYQGTIAVTAAGSQPVDQFPIRIEVLPFQLPAPYYTSSIYYRGILSSRWPDGTISSEYKSPQQLEAELGNMMAHGVTNPIIYMGVEDNYQRLAAYLQTRQAVGMSNEILYYLGIYIGNLTPARVTEVINFTGPFGTQEIYFHGQDEATGDALINQRPIWEAIHQAGGKIFVAGGNENFPLMGDIQDVLVKAGVPTAEEAARWHGNGHHIWSYANPQSGPENPDMHRRNFGLLLWKTNYDGPCTYAYQHSFGNIWNDADHYQYRDHAYTLPTVDGVIDTIAWEGFREGVTDVRYVTALQNALRDAAATGTHPQTAAQAQAMLDGIDPDVDDLDQVRSRVIEYLLDLQSTSTAP